MAMIVMMTRLGNAEATPATTPPSVPLCLRPMNTEVLIMIMPGRHWAMA